MLDDFINLMYFTNLKISPNLLLGTKIKEIKNSAKF